MRGGFDAFVGNPPFLGGSRISQTHGSLYLAYLMAAYEEAHGNADLVAYFFRRCFANLRAEGTFGLVATNTIAQGDTRGVGLRAIRKRGGTIYEARRRLRWPGHAAVVVSIVHVVNGDSVSAHILDGRPVETITAFLFHRGDDADPARLLANSGKSYKGSFVYGMGFVFDDDDEGANSTATMRQVVAADPRCSERIQPYLGGEELNGSPTHAPTRWVINFGELSEDEARRWPTLMHIVEERVKPMRLAQNREIRARYWWRFGETAPALYRAVADLDRVIACSQTSKHRTFTFLPTGIVFDQKIVVILLRSEAAFAVLQSRAHEQWALFFGSTMKDDPVYTSSDCFETFPFPDEYEADVRLREMGKSYFEVRAALMVKNNEGLTKTYNHFHDSAERSFDILKLRELHAQMDRAVLDAYGWTDIHPVYDFREQLDESIRLTWADETRDEVLARLLELNRGRAEAEAESKGDAKVPRRTAQKKAKSDENTRKLFPEDDR